MAVIAEVQELVVAAATVLALVLTAITMSVLLVRQFRWFAFDGLSRESDE